MNRRFIYFSLVGLVLFCGSCAKTKIDSLLAPSGQEVSSNSSIRLFNFYNFNLDLTINNIPLTSYGTNGTQAGLSLFPSGSWMNTDNGNPFFVPSSLVTKDRKVHVLISVASGSIPTGVKFSPLTIDTVLTDDPLNPNDYYALANGHLLVIPRNTEAPVEPDHFKIRVINLGATPDANDLYGRVKLTYSDGSSVDPRLDTVGPGSSSPYIDLPYGAFMFKLFINGDFTKQLAELPLLPNMDICDYPGHFPVVQQALFPQVRTFKPGATYSIVITQALQVFPACSYATVPVAIPYNAYRIITEQSPGPNVTYARMDAVNALPVTSLSIKVDGMPLGGQLAYTGHTDYGILVQGTHQVQAVATDGTVLASGSITLSPYDDYTAWVYQSTSGKPAICFANTDMTSTLYQTDPNGNVFTQNTQSGVVHTPPVDDGTNGTIRVKSIPYAWQTRFLNLTPDVPYVTFTNDVSPFPSVTSMSTAIGYGDSTNFADASINLAPGETPGSNPFVIEQFEPSFGTTGTPDINFTSNPGQYQGVPPSVIRVFQSSPGPPAVVPGILLGGVKPLPCAAYIANPALYPSAAFIPVSEPGVYTTALVGKALTATNQLEAAQLIILKHYK